MKNNRKDLFYTSVQSNLVKKGNKLNSFNFTKSTIKKISITKEIPESILSLAITNISPSFLLKTQKKGKRIIQIPKPLFNESKRVSVGVQWLVRNSKKQNKKTFLEKFFTEVIDASKNQGFSKKFQQDMNMLVLQNRAVFKN